ncbi:Na+/H+ antiporter NhaC [Paenibacillus crassostreae]|uniref:Sodium:proton antiporter n=1 Tax=Paenibacillus crassostreae TaxID=1763538 RepID=A0A162N7T9_9BACL|nr:Na+/H+ antiporter NhaC [Paenibacillus crassostreae]AOZ93747.1 Na+/H+ antiporter NhaC [Paenibacillus crassostreae]OAB71282.1 sodium:proton antiporter [Paenibacillus crassostreae]
MGKQQDKQQDKQLKQFKEKVIKAPTLFQALLPVIAMIVFLSLGYVLFELPPEPLIILSAIVAGIIAIMLGHSYNDIMGSISDKIAKTMPAILILITVGFMIGAWMVGGTIPMMIYYGLQIINPQFLIITAFLVTAIVSICTGTSWGSAGTIGVAFMGVAAGMDANMAAVAGAVVAGAYFGDKLSPLSDTTNIASLATGVNLYEHIGHLLYTTIPSFIVAGIVYVITGLNSSSAGEIPEKVGTILSTLDSVFSWNWLLILPVLIVLYGSLTKKPTVPVMLISSFVAMANGLIFQDFTLNNVVTATVSGFNLSMVNAAGFDLATIIPDIPRLLERGGMNSMMGTLLICFSAITFAGTISVTKSLDLIINKLMRLVHSTGSMILTTIVIGLSMIGITSNGQISILMPGEMLREAYIRRGLHPKNLSRTIEDSATIIEPILPWTAAGAYMAGTLGVATLDYLPWAVLCWTGIIFATIWGFTGFGIAKLTPEQQQEMLKEFDTEPKPAQ